MVNQNFIERVKTHYYFDFYILLSLIIMTSFLMFKNSFSADFFIFDDIEHYKKSLTYSNASFFEIITKYKSGMPSFYKTWSFIISNSPEHLHIFLLRVLSLSIHIFNTILFFFISKNLIKRNFNLHLILISFIFFIHPVQLESVLWVSSIKGTLAASLCGLSWLFYSESKKTNKKVISYLYYLYSILLFALAVFTKATIAVFPIFILMINSLIYREKIIKSLGQAIPFFSIAIPVISHQIWSYNPGIIHHLKWGVLHYLNKSQYFFYIIFSTLIISSIMYKLIPSLKKGIKRVPSFYYKAIAVILFFLPWTPLFPDILTKIRRAFFIFAFSIYKVVFPIKNGIDYGINDKFIDTIFPMTTFFFLFITLLLIFYKLRKKTYYFYFLSSLFLFSIPFLGFFHFSFSNISYYADRFSYIPLAIILLFFLFKISRKEWTYSTTLLFTIALILTFRTSQIVPKWQSSSLYLEHSLLTNPASVPTMISLANSYEKDKLFTKALNTYEKATLMDYSYTESYISRINLLIRIKQHKEALSYINHIRDFLPEIDRRIFGLEGLVQFKLKNYSEAKKTLGLAIKMDPNDTFSKDLLQIITKMENNR